MAKTRQDIEPDGHKARKDIEPDGHAARKFTEDDVEGHSMLLNPTLGRDLEKARSADVDRSVRSRNQEAEAKRIYRR